jgi:hypothetical protein
VEADKGGAGRDGWSGVPPMEYFFFRTGDFLDF